MWVHPENVRANCNWIWKGYDHSWDLGQGLDDDNDDVQIRLNIIFLQDKSMIQITKYAKMTSRAAFASRIAALGFFILTYTLAAQTVKIWEEKLRK